MLVLFVITFAIVKQKNEKLTASANQLELIKEVEKALESLSDKYFVFDDINKRYKLNIDVIFNAGSDNINDLSTNDKKYLKEAGIELYNTIDSLINDNPKIEYLLVIEGNTQRYCPPNRPLEECNYNRIPDEGYNLSYRRALALVNYWKNECKIPFDKINKNCELIIAGSGYFGQSREENETNNRRFSIQVTSKVGKLLNQ